MADSTQNRSEAPSARRREDARKRGQFASSADLANGLFLLGALLLVSSTGPALANNLQQLFRWQLRVDGAVSRDWTVAHTVSLAKWLGGYSITLASSLLIGGFAFASLSHVVQSGFHVSPDVLKFDPGNLSPAKGMKRIFSLRGLIRTGLSIAKFSLILAAILATYYLLGWSVFFAKVPSLPEIVAHGWEMGIFSGVVAAVTLIGLGGADFLYQRWQLEQDLMMTRQEVRDERKQDEGDPLIRTRIRKMQREVAKLQMLRDVPQANVVITNPTHLAIAIKYERNKMAAPVVLAKGKDLMAKRIREIAQRHGIPVIERKPLARTLFAAVEVGQAIPVSLYRAVAEILAHVYQLRRQ